MPQQADLIQKIQELEEKVRILQMENDQLAERAEDTLLLGLIAEQISGAEEIGQVLESGLERISVLKDIPFCACCSLTGNKAIIFKSYLSFTGEDMSSRTIDLPETMMQQLNAGHYFLSKNECRQTGISFKEKAGRFIPLSAIGIPFKSRFSEANLFFFGDDKAADRLPNVADMLHRVTEMIVSRMDNISLLCALQDQNRDLDRNVEERTRDLRESEERFRRLAENARDVIYRMSLPDGRYEYVSPASTEIFGYAPEEFYGTPQLIRNVIPPDWQEYFEEQWSRLLRGDMPPTYEFSIIHKSGEIRWINQRNILIRDDGGRIIAIEGIVTNITDRKRAEEALKESEANYSDLYENAPDMYVSVSAKTALIEKCNHTLANTLGYSKEEILGRPVFEIYHPDCLEEVKKTFKLFVETGTICDKELQLQKKDGSKLDVSLNVSSVRGDLGDILFSRSTLRDITERKRNYAINASRWHLMQFAVTHSLDELLEETLNEAQNLTDSLIGFYHFVKEDQKSLTLQNWSTSTKKNFCRAEGKGRHYAITEAGVWVDCVYQRKPVIHNDYTSLPHRKGLPEGHAEVVRELVVPVLRGKTIKAILGVGNKPANYVEKDVEAISLLADLAWEIAERKQVDEALGKLNEELEQRVLQRTIELEKKSDELRNSQMALMNIVEDLNEKTAELEQANAKLRELDRLKSMFIASMSHELRTPLNSIIGFSSILCEEWLGPLNEEQRKNLETVLRAGRYLLALINDVIDVSKVEAGKMETSHEAFDLYDVMVETAALFIKEAHDKGLELTIEPHHQKMWTDRRRLSQCLINLISNAVKFTERGSVKMMARVLSSGGAGRARTMVELLVEDTGIGIREEDLGQLFGAFVRLKTPATMSVKGTGLGLYLTRKITNELLQGDVEVRSSFGKGSRFSLRIPVQREEGFNEKSARR